MKKRKRLLKNIVVGVIIMLMYVLQQQNIIPKEVEDMVSKTVEQTISQAEANQPGLYKVEKFTDGDTISVDMNGTIEKVRLIGVDTPETSDPRKEVQCFGDAASRFTKQLIGDNRVRLESDHTNTNRDRYNRLLRYVYLPDGTLVNAEIIKQGYGFAYVYFPFTKMEEFKELQNQAESALLGLWSSCDVLINDSGQGSTSKD